MNAWGQYSNPPSRESAEMQECRRLHNLWPKSELALPLTFKGEASMEFVDWYFQAAWDEAVAQSHLQKQFPSREQWLVMKAQDLKDIAEKFGLSKGGKKLDIYSRIMEHILQELPTNIYLPLAELDERIPIFPYSLDSDQLAKLYLNSQTASKPIRDMIKHTYFTPETFKQLLKWEEKFEGGILDQDKDGCILLGRYFSYYLVMNPHFDLNLLLLRDPAVLSDRHNILTLHLSGLSEAKLQSNSLRGQLLNENSLMGDNEVLGMSNLLSHNQLLTFDLLQGLFGIFLPSSLGHPSGLDLTATSAMNREWRESLVKNPCVPTSLIRLLCDHEPDLLDSALQNPNLSSAFIIDLWENLSHSQLEELLIHNSFIPRELIHSLFEKENRGVWQKWKGYALSDEDGATSIVQKCLGQYHLPMWVLKGLKPYNDPDYFTADHLWTDERTLDAEILGLNPNPEILEYALEHFSVFLEGGSPRYTIAQNPSLSIELLKKYYADFDADDVARNPALTLDFIKAYYQNPTIEGVQKAGLHNHISELTANSAIFPYDPTPEWASGLFNWRF
jgi:hypothetical protein